MTPSEDPFVDPNPTLAPDRGPLGAAAREERRRRRRRRALRRLDVAIGLIVGIIVIVVAPGLALAGIIGAVVLIVAGLWVLVERRRRARRATRQRSTMH